MLITGIYKTEQYLDLLGIQLNYKLGSHNRWILITGCHVAFQLPFKKQDKIFLIDLILQIVAYKWENLWDFGPGKTLSCL